ncbi:MAG: hypothetical protein RLY14_1794 [Planctomycetota bacterium]|jgi:hypothetical protein
MNSTSSPKKVNRFERHKKKLALATTVIMLLLVELTSYVLVLSFGHRNQRQAYPYNRIISGYTVYRHTPGFDFGASTLRCSPDDRTVAFDNNGFICDSEVTVAKPKGVVRIFLMGGSAVIGAGQTDGYEAVHKYPWGNYSYRCSIAGHLQNFLSERFPQTQFQVITSASYGRRLHQSHLEYSTLISRFSPDIVISCDGMNDLASIESGTPYEDVEADLSKYIDLWNHHHRKSFISRTNTYYVLEKLSQRLKLDRLFANHTVLKPTASADSEAEYQNNRDDFIENAARFQQIVKHFRATVESDGATFVFCLQPLLHRTKINKRLSKIEIELDRLMLVPSRDAQSAGRMRQINRYFFDDYLSTRLSDMLAQGKFFVDANSQIQDVDDSVEFFTDYCHLTEEGNRMTAEILGQHLVSQIGFGWSKGKD